MITPTFRANLLLFLLLALLASCSSIHEFNGPANPDFDLHKQAVLAHPNWQLGGRLSVRQGNNADTVALNWLQKSDNFDITLRSSLLGLGTTHVFGADSGVTVERAGQATVNLPNLKALTRDYLHFEFPASYLLYWVRGLPTPTLTARMEFDDNHLLTHLTQRDASNHTWELSFDRYTAVEGLPLPGRIRLDFGEFQLAFLISTWQFSPSASTP